MKPYIEKNDGVPDNNRYSEALEAAKETVEALNKLTDQALAQYTALVDSAVAGHITDERELEHIMDGLLDFGDDLRFLEIYKRLCRHIFYKHLQMVGEHIYLWRMQFDTKDEEDENEYPEKQTLQPEERLPYLSALPTLAVPHVQAQPVRQLQP